MPIKLEPIIEMPNMVTGLWRQFGVHVFEGKLTMADMVHLDEVGSAWRKKNPERTVELVIVYPSDTVMTGEERTRMARIIKRWEHQRTASATVILATGLTGALHRSVLTGLQLIVPAPHPVKVFGTTMNAVLWLTPHIQKLLGPDATFDAVLQGVNELCEAFKKKRASL